jgi:GAF domain
MTIDAQGRDLRAGAVPANDVPDWPAITGWAAGLARRIAAAQPSQHVAVFVPDLHAEGMRLVAQFWGAGEDTGDVVVGEWLVPMVGSVTGRVFRTGSAALCADVTLDPDYRDFPGGRSRSCLTVPVGGPGAVVAVINVEAPWTGAFSIRDYDHLTAAAADARATFPGRAAD